MDRKSISRRDMLVVSAAFGAFAFLPGGADALLAQPVESAGKKGLSLYGRCDGPREHADLLARLRTQLAKDAAARTASASCPLCGCRVTTWR